MKADRVKKALVRGTLASVLAAGLAVSLQGCILPVALVAGGGALVATDRRTVGAQTEDREIQVKAIKQMGDEFPDTAHVDVAVFNRRVLLTGEVPNQAVKDRAEQIVRNINNVNAIVNELEIQPKASFQARASDSYLEGRVKAALIAEKGISANDFKVVCSDGNIYLMGLVTKDEGAIGADVASRVMGVMQVTKVFQYIQPQEAQALEASASAAANAPVAQAPADDQPTVEAVPMSSISSQSIQTQAPSPVSESNVLPGGNTQSSNR
jgi:osmotically-inducible protein OsmY